MSNNAGEILLVEDNMDDAALTIRALKKVNLADGVVHLEDGQEALDYLFGGKYATKPKVIMLDIKMPRVDGIEVLRRVKADESTRAIPVVIMTSSSEEKDLIASYELGVNSYVVKPVEFENFAKAVSELGMYWLLTNQIPNS
jgi:two-component system response regulator